MNTIEMKTENKRDLLQSILAHQEHYKRQLKRQLSISEAISLMFSEQQKDQAFFANTEILEELHENETI